MGGTRHQTTAAARRAVVVAVDRRVRPRRNPSLSTLPTPATAPTTRRFGCAPPTNNDAEDRSSMLAFATPSPKKQRRTTLGSNRAIATAGIVTPDTVMSSSTATPHRLFSTAITNTVVPPRNDDDDAGVSTTFLDLHVGPEELRPSATLTTGQCFHWIRISRIQSPEVAEGGGEGVTSSAADDDDDDNDPVTVKTLTARRQNNNSSNSNSEIGLKQSAWGSHNATEWIGTLRVSSTSHSLLEGGEPKSMVVVVVALKETPTTVWYRTLYAPRTVNVRSCLIAYFQLETNNATTKDTTPAATTSRSVGEQQQTQLSEITSGNLSSSAIATADVAGATEPPFILERVSLSDLYGDWSSQCDRLRRIATCLPGVRIVDQDPWECLVSFLCSTNNNIPRITKMLQAIRRRYGKPIVSVVVSDSDEIPWTVTYADENAAHDDSTTNDGKWYYSFPSLEELHHQATEADLRSFCGMGYRAKYLIETMNLLMKLGGESYLHELRSLDDPIQVQEKLIQFSGVGRKVADCVALFSLQQADAIPVDVHVWNIARRDYGADALLQTTKSLTPTVYKQIGDLFRSRFQPRSGWAHSLLFVAELPSFRQALPDDMIDEMDRVSGKKTILAIFTA